MGFAFSAMLCPASRVRQEREHYAEQNNPMNCLPRGISGVAYEKALCRTKQSGELFCEREDFAGVGLR